MGEINSDAGYFSDFENSLVVEGEMEFEAETIYHNRPFNDTDIELVIESELDAEVTQAIDLDLINLFPEFMRTSEILQAYVKECGRQFGVVLTKTEEIIKLLSPNTVTSAKYLRLLGALLGVKFPPEDDTSEAELRKILSQTVDWYKLKGTYRALEIICNSQNFKVNIYDMYTNDYTNFVLTDWFVGSEGENPPGLDVTYYKSPHFGLEIILNQVYENLSD